eukprot:TRINITY_DN94467_c0_g1_i1.p1 TRINITY_DN94467_c0_g1~~TRINITY_DN94467_c0_g1_i1.p1  ORF type:complete len:188 (-),score=35.70 TRINITY_DN94467_c0_g1_i1:51-614(-)
MHRCFIRFASVAARNKSPYEILGVASSAPIEEVKAAYRRLALQFHPDRNNGDDKHFKTITAAYTSIKDGTATADAESSATPEQRTQQYTRAEREKHAKVWAYARQMKQQPAFHTTGKLWHDWPWWVWAICLVVCWNVVQWFFIYRHDPNAPIRDWKWVSMKKMERNRAIYDDVKRRSEERKAQAAAI